ncbi:MAG: GNAT family N-acetyltransferase [Sphingobacterium sp.]
MHISDKRSIHIEELKEVNNIAVSDLVALTLDIVQGGASVGFMQDINEEKASEFWNNVLAKVQQEKTVLLVAKDSSSDQIVGTVQLQIDLPQNQPHRADVAKMLVHSAFRRLGIAENLLQHLELIAKKMRKSLLVLDTVTDSPAHALYLKCGWKVVGNIPNYALFPNGTSCSTTYFYKNLE